MASINKIVPGQTLYDAQRNVRWRPSDPKWKVWPVLVEEVNIEEGFIVARWNVVNPARKMYENSIKALRVKDPNKQQTTAWTK